MRSLIAIPGRRAERVAGLRFSGTVAAAELCEAVWAAGGEPVVLHVPGADPVAELDARLARADGVVLPGGGDIDPRRYGQEPAAHTEPPAALHDRLDLAVIDTVLRLGTPTVAICRGMQVLNVALGGSLIQHLRPGPVEHRDATHAVRVEPGSRLRAIVGADLLDVSSYHHQAVGRLGRGLTVAALAADGCVEAVEHAGGTILGVQWHPEDLHRTSATDAALFAAVVEAAAERRKTRA